MYGFFREYDRYIGKGLRGLLAVVLFALVAGAAGSAFAASATLGFESQGLDLDTGTVVDLAPGPGAGDTGADLLITYNADVLPHSVAMPAGQGTEVAYLGGQAFGSVTAGSIGGTAFSANPVDAPLGPNDTVLVRTASGAVYKVGDASEGAVSVTISYELLQ